MTHIQITFSHWINKFLSVSIRANTLNDACNIQHIHIIFRTINMELVFQATVNKYLDPGISFIEPLNCTQPFSAHGNSDGMLCSSVCFFLYSYIDHLVCVCFVSWYYNICQNHKSLLFTYFFLLFIPFLFSSHPLRWKRIPMAFSCFIIHNIFTNNSLDVIFVY